jgi:hypothetical protein
VPGACRAPLRCGLCGLARLLSPRPVRCIREAAPRRGCPGGAGWEEGPHTGPGQRPSPDMRRGRGWPCHAEGAGRGGLGPAACAETPAGEGGPVLRTGGARRCPGRRPAHPRPAGPQAGSGPGHRPCRAWPRGLCQAGQLLGAGGMGAQPPGGGCGPGPLARGGAAVLARGPLAGARGRLGTRAEAAIRHPSLEAGPALASLDCLAPAPGQAVAEAGEGAPTGQGGGVVGALRAHLGEVRVALGRWDRRQAGRAGPPALPPSSAGGRMPRRRHPARLGASRGSFVAGPPGMACLERAGPRPQALPAWAPRAASPYPVQRQATAIPRPGLSGETTGPGGRGGVASQAVSSSCGRAFFPRSAYHIRSRPVSQQTRRRERLREWKEFVRHEAMRYWTSSHVPADGPVCITLVYLYDEAA